ncbi:MAG: hypothetical protein AAGH15_23660 [Myxococcota bacterium]
MERFPGSFGTPEGGVRDAGLRGEGELSRSETGWCLECRRAPKPLRVALGGAGFLAGIVLTAMATFLLAEGTGLDLMGARKGPGLVAMVALVVALGGWSLLTGLADRALGRPRVVTPGGDVPVQVTEHAKDAKALNVLWHEDGAWVGAAFTPAEAADRARLLQG